MDERRIGQIYLDFFFGSVKHRLLSSGKKNFFLVEKLDFVRRWQNGTLAAKQNRNKFNRPVFMNQEEKKTMVTRLWGSINRLFPGSDDNHSFHFPFTTNFNKCSLPCWSFFSLKFHSFNIFNLNSKTINRNKICAGVCVYRVGSALSMTLFLSSNQPLDNNFRSNNNDN